MFFSSIKFRSKDAKNYQEDESEKTQNPPKRTIAGILRNGLGKYLKYPKYHDINIL